ncbi:MAG: carbonic anhydrase [Alphaproteobacteria bacterium]|nr:carbonic anhydrase [Alphaproteobacteria bacterium]
MKHFSFDEEYIKIYILLMKKAITNLIEGYQKFCGHYFDRKNSTFANLVLQGQRPKVLVIACSDSRVDPALMMNCQPGDLFVIRNVANLVPPYEDDQAYHGTSAALEFGVCVLKVQHVILLGHTQCGGIQLLLEHLHRKDKSRSFLTKWMELAKVAHDTTIESHADNTLAEKIHLCGQHSLVNSLKNLRTFPWIEESIKQGELSLHAWNFNMSNGTLEEYDEQMNCFKVIGSPQQHKAYA